MLDEEVTIPVDTQEADFYINLCMNNSSFTIEEFNACSNFISANLIVSYSCVIVGILVGFIFAKAVADGWKS